MKCLTPMLVATGLFLIVNDKAYCQVSDQSVDYHQPILMAIESNLGYLLKNDKRSKLIGGFGLWSYIPIDEFHGKRISTLGISIPLRYQLASKEDREFLGYENIFSISAVARVSKKMHPDKNAIWFFLGLGPEHRTQWDGNF